MRLPLQTCQMRLPCHSFQTSCSCHSCFACFSHYSHSCPEAPQLCFIEQVRTAMQPVNLNPQTNTQHAYKNSAHSMIMIAMVPFAKTATLYYHLSANHLAIMAHLRECWCFLSYCHSVMPPVEVVMRAKSESLHTEHSDNDYVNLWVRQPGWVTHQSRPRALPSWRRRRRAWRDGRPCPHRRRPCGLP